MHIPQHPMPPDANAIFHTTPLRWCQIIAERPEGPQGHTFTIKVWMDGRQKWSPARAVAAERVTPMPTANANQPQAYTAQLLVKDKEIVEQFITGVFATRGYGREALDALARIMECIKQAFSSNEIAVAASAHNHMITQEALIHLRKLTSSDNLTEQEACWHGARDFLKRFPND